MEMQVVETQVLLQLLHVKLELAEVVELVQLQVMLVEQVVVPVVLVKQIIL
tara:strand:+ start:410 stop:562 length:153 start_codon:yes stop_codon:yes gene_type:complete